ncbi:MAG: class I SAM-dependent methyltransferase, partial [Candidatus Krumholzibacteriota bacterium]
FEDIYLQADGDADKVLWADLEPNPRLLSWLENTAAFPGKKAITIGCGLGDDAEALAARGFQVTAFDISATAIEMCRERFPNSPVDYVTMDLFAVPPAWSQGFDLVFECNTIQILDGDLRLEALNAIADLVRPGGRVLVSCRRRETGEIPDAFPIPLDREEIDGFLSAGLVERDFSAYTDDEDPPIDRFFAVYERP